MAGRVLRSSLHDETITSVVRSIPKRRLAQDHLKHTRKGGSPPKEDSVNFLKHTDTLGSLTHTVADTLTLLTPKVTDTLRSLTPTDKLGSAQTQCH